ncbi:MAG TPA: TorF family putative porin [Sphingomicrobium sp.]|jgi:uncharacterized protein (TIGR02001 family)|nr:TorF family putative porin [Sphingomicrobium sp.]
MRFKPLLMSAALAGLAIAATPAAAQDSASQPDNKAEAGQTVTTPDEEEEASTPFELEIAVSAVSDYRFRGISLSDKDPAFQPSITLSHESGLYGSIWASTVAENDGADIEVDYILGYAPSIGGFDLDVNATYYAYPRATDLNYWEFIGNVSHSVGPGSVGLTFAYTPKQGATVPKRGVYYAINGELPLGEESPFTLTASFGIEDNAFYDKKRDWSLGINADVEGFAVGLAYVDTSRTGGDPLGRRGLVFSLSKAFTFGF